MVKKRIYIKELHNPRACHIYPFILIKAHDSLVERQTNFRNNVIMTTYFSKSKNNGKINKIHPRQRKDYHFGTSIFLRFLAHVALMLQL